LLAKNEVLEKFDEVMQYTVETLEGRWEMTYEKIFSVLMKSSYPMKSDSVDDLEQKLEHAIVHILRHRRQIEKFLANS
jgi:predicted ATP-dependent Lon-type protease